MWLSSQTLTVILVVLGILFCLASLIQLVRLYEHRKYSSRLAKLAALAGVRSDDTSYDKVEFALRSLGWELDTLRKERVVPLSEDIFSRLTKFFSSKQGDEKEFFEQTLHFLSRHFRAPALGLVIIEGETARTYTTGVKGVRFQTAVQQIVLTELNRGLGGESIILTDLKTDKDFHNSLELFGIRHSLTAPYVWKQEDGKQFSGALWFGYDETTPPTHLEKHWATEFSKRLGADFYSSRKLHQLQGQVEEVKQQSGEKDDYLAHISHDIKTPLNNIKAILQLLRLETDGRHHEFIDVALTNSQSLSELVDGVLEYTKHRAGKLVATPQSFSLYKCAEEVTESFQVSAYRKELLLTFGGDESLFVHADQKQVKRILTNLVSNAIKYTDSGTISVAVFDSEQGPKVSVVDTGIGMNEEHLATIFEPFTRFAERKAEGAGIGMALTKILTDLNKGHIVASSRVRQGTRIEITLPRGKAQPQEFAQPAPTMNLEQSSELQSGKDQAESLPEGRIIEPPKTSVFNKFVTNAEALNSIPPTVDEQPLLPPSDSEVKLDSDTKTQPEQLSKKVLLIDDDFDLVDSLSRMLSTRGYTVLTATSEQEALGICNFSAPDIVVADYDMPGGGVATFLEDCIVLRDIPDCIVLTGIERNLDHPSIKGLMLKPVDIDALCNLIEGPAAASKVA